MKRIVGKALLIFFCLTALLYLGCGDSNDSDNDSSVNTSTDDDLNGNDSSVSTNPDNESNTNCTSGSFCEQMVNSHNKVRHSVNAGTYWDQPVPGTPVADVVWDELLAEVAHNYASDCHWGHNSNRSAEYAAAGGSGYVGENIAASSGNPTTDSVVDSQWGAEAKSYNYSNNSCSGVCGHYTQVAWKTSTRIGCARVHCDSFTGGISWSGYFTVCNYAPGGNMNGQRPY